ncbi:LADA_0A09120g1_1 [Lachancea dasiensis]|uniref:LADA_0A09120g1_1 n=1 Tax=Lachancea dasiensis TaxID=1072105 RepID=A0A1G4IQL8_9SACH|nr:LADA_0A09120g1_1 [Lachancea dasiensis]
MPLSRTRSSHKQLSRKKACIPCSKAKVRCDQRRKHCSRCLGRRVSSQCRYPDSLDIDTNDGRLPQDNCEKSVITPLNVALCSGVDNFNTDLVGAQKDLKPVVPVPVCTADKYNCGEITPSTLTEHLTDANRYHLEDEKPFRFEELDLICTVNYQEIQNRWLNNYIPPLDHEVKNYPSNVTSFISKMLRAYSSMPIRREAFPPFVHISQNSPVDLPTPLAVCLSLMRMFHNRVPSQDFVIKDALAREMSRLYQQHGSFDEVNLLAAFQAYLIYSMATFFEFDQCKPTGLHQAMVNLQNIACEVSKRGICCSAEVSRSIPKWESWIVAEAKRRTIFTMYLFDSLLCSHDGLPTFLAKELKGTFAPSSGSLWRATTRKRWNELYQRYLCEWGSDGPLVIDELWPVPSDICGQELKRRRIRIDHWLTEVDDYGTMLFAITSCTHGDQ